MKKVEQTTTSLIILGLSEGGAHSAVYKGKPSQEFSLPQPKHHQQPNKHQVTSKVNTPSRV